MRAALALAACLALSACGGDNHLVVPDGLLIVDWTVVSTKDPTQCAATGATTIDITVTNASGGSAGEFQQDCEAFSTSITLPPGTYSAQAVLLDLHGTALTTAVDIAPFTLFGGDQLVIPINFPRVSFF